MHKKRPDVKRATKAWENKRLKGLRLREEEQR